MVKVSSIHLGFFLSMVIADGCGGTLGGNPPGKGSNPEPSKALSFVITDAPLEDAKNVFITIESLSLLKADGEWLNIPLENQTEIDLLHYQDGLTSPLAAIAEITPGTYSQTRLILSDTAPARLVDLSGVVHNLKIPSGSETGLKINAPIVIDGDLPKTFVIDFDLRKSIKVSGNMNNPNAKYVMKPVLRMIEDRLSGTVEGPATNGDVFCLYLKGTAMDNSDDCENAVVSGKAKNSKFIISFIPPGEYHLRAFRNHVLLKDLADVVIEEKSLTKLEGM